MRFSKLALVVKMGLAAVTLSVGFCAVNSAQAADVKWDDIRGVSSPVGVKDNNDPELNTVGVGTGVTVPGRRPWSTKSGKAKIDLRNGRLEFEVRGLVLGGGAFTGTTPTPPPHMVQGRLVCDTNGSLPGGNSVLVDTPPVPLSPDGDAEFHGNVALPPACSEPDIAFLIINAVEGPPSIFTIRWIAYGAVRKP